VPLPPVKLTREVARQFRESLAKHPPYKVECHRCGEEVEVRNDTYYPRILAEHGRRDAPCRGSGWSVPDNERRIKRRTKGLR
jgi:hypothetical protein